MISIYDGLRAACAECGLELDESADIGLLENALNLSGFNLTVEGSRVTATRDGHFIALEPALRTLAMKPELQSLFLTPVARVTKLSQLKTTLRRCQFIEQRGLSQFERLVAAHQ